MLIKIKQIKQNKLLKNKFFCKYTKIKYHYIKNKLIRKSFIFFNNNNNKNTLINKFVKIIKYLNLKIIKLK